MRGGGRGCTCVLPRLAGSGATAHGTLHRGLGSSSGCGTHVTHACRCSALAWLPQVISDFGFGEAVGWPASPSSASCLRCHQPLACVDTCCLVPSPCIDCIGVRQGAPPSSPSRPSASPSPAGPWKKAAEDFLGTFEPTYFLREKRIGSPGAHSFKGWALAEMRRAVPAPVARQLSLQGSATTHLSCQRKAMPRCVRQCWLLSCGPAACRHDRCRHRHALQDGRRGARAAGVAGAVPEPRHGRQRQQPADGGDARRARLPGGLCCTRACVCWGVVGCSLLMALCALGSWESRCRCLL